MEHKHESEVATVVESRQCRHGVPWVMVWVEIAATMTVPAEVRGSYVRHRTDPGGFYRVNVAMACGQLFLKGIV